MEDNNYSLEQMRSDYQSLRSNLEKQEIINDRLLREVTRTKVSKIRGRAGISIGCAISVMILAPFVFHYNPAVNASWTFISFTELLMAFCLFIDWKFNRKVQSANLTDCDLLSFCKDVKELKKRYQDWLKWGIMLASLWLIWLILEVWFRSDMTREALPMIVGMVVGFLAGGLIGTGMNRKVIRTCDEIIDNLENN